MPPSDEKKNDKRKLVDITKPGKTPPDASSRPIIVTQRPMVQDPMVSDVSDTEKKPDAKVVTDTPKPTTHSEKVLIPPDDMTTEKEKTDADVKEEPPSIEENKEVSQTEPNLDVKDQETSDKKANKEAEEKQLKDEQERTEKIEKLVETKKYFVKVGEVSRRRRSRSMAILLIFLLIFAGLYLAVDADVIKVEVDLPYDFIKNN